MNGSRLCRAGVGLGLVGLGQAGCAELIDPYEYGEVEVVAERRSGEPVWGMNLLLYWGTRHLEFAETDRQGRHVFRRVPFGATGLFAHAPGPFRHLDRDFGVDPYTFTMTEGEVRTITFMLVRVGPGEVTVRVRDPDDVPIGGVVLRLSKLDPPSADPSEGETDGAGTYTFPDVPFGFYEVAVLPGPGYVVPEEGASRDDVIVEDGVEEEVDFTLERDSGGAPTGR